MAEVIVDAVAERLGKRRLCPTRDFRLDGAPEEPWGEFAEAEVKALRRQHRLDDEAAWHLVDRYGTLARDVAGYLATNLELAEPVVAGYPDLRVEFRYQREQEMAVKSEDFLLRRTRLGLVQPELLRREGFVY
jgi:glycerol-3-phosphate dehydrogenase